MTRDARQHQNRRRSSLVPTPHSHHQRRDLDDEPVLDILLILADIPTICEADIELLNEVGNDHAHLLQCQVLADTVRRAEGERSEGVNVVGDLLGRLLEPFCDEPPVRNKRLRVRKHSRITMERVGLGRDDSP